ncbi:hypothetical protein GTQ99_09430, partial [Kineococcus sp. T13]
VQALAALAERPLPPTTSRRLRGEALERCSRADVDRWAAALVEAVDLGAFDVSPASTPWAGAQLRSPEAAERALRRVQRLVGEQLPAVRALLATTCDAAGLRGASSVAEAQARTALLEGVRATTARFGPEVFAQSLGDVAAATATPQWRKDRDVRLGVLARWRLRRQARALVRPDVEVADAATLHEWLQQARAQRLTWQRVAVREAVPAAPADLDALVTEVGELRHELLALAEVLPARTWTELGAASPLEVQLPELTTLLRSLAADAAALETLPRRTVLLDELTAAGWRPLLEELQVRWSGPGSLDLPAEVQAAWWAGVLDTTALADPHVGAADAAGLRRARHELQLAVAAAHARQARAVRAAVDARADGDGDAAALLPVTAVSAAGVAALADRLGEADLVVVLGAQATATATALPALARARQVLVVGDPALPGPVDLHTAREREEVPADAAGSLFADTGGVLPTLRLDRQHALLDDGLLAGVPQVLRAAPEDSLPGPGRDGRRVVRTSGRPPGARRGPDALVDLAVDAALGALRSHPEESLGVVVPDAAGAELLADAVRRRALAAGLPLAVGREPLLVAAAGRWAGERRDHVLVLADAVLNGPGLGAAGSAGAGRAQVWMALTRSRLRTTLLLDDSGWASPAGAGAGAGAGDVAEGRRLLVQLALAWERPHEDGGARGRSPLVRRLAAACADAGLPVELEVGTSRVLPLVVRDARSRVGTGPALAVHLDDPAWAAAEVVDREVDGPTRLERRGWRYVQVLGADVHADAAAEAGRIAALWREVLAEAGHDLPWVLDVASVEEAPGEPEQAVAGLAAGSGQATGGPGAVREREAS